MKLASLVIILCLLSIARASTVDCSQYNSNKQSCLNQNSACGWVTSYTCIDTCRGLTSYAACSAKGNACQSSNVQCTKKYCPYLSDNECKTTEYCTLTSYGACDFLNDTNPCIVDENTPCDPNNCKDTAECKLAGATDCSVNDNQNGCNVSGCFFKSDPYCSTVTPGTITYEKMITFCFSLLAFVVVF